MLRTLICCLALLMPVGAGATLPAGVTLVPGHWTPGGQPDGNSVLFDGAEGLVLLDTGRHIDHARLLIETVRARGKPLRWIVNSHWHLDHIGGNAELRAAFPQARLMASDSIRGARSGFLARYRGQVLEQLDKPDTSEAQRMAFRRELAIIDNQAAQTPDVRVQATGEQALAGRRFIVGLARQAATAGDVWLHDIDARVLASGDLVTLPVPFFDTACAERWSAALDTLAAQSFEQLIPGHGPAMSREEFERYRRGFKALLLCAASTKPGPDCTSGWIDALGELIPAAEQRLAKNYLGYYLEEHLRAAPDKARAFCPKAG
ncbi:MBL fold metallo-hydrolase [Aquabacterium sp.]|uniref:MBL fold metallo-hydrolase n=1 Tax=Aquabacterium sp. TaxID=1872578 RepID=UPI002C6A5871|nr:MBL fold metallo-hydrolase [Aquabacterium sp.]HSW06079.1 MBL fold metallo-hydrolase [Aquabacterium sp.]